MRFAWCWGDFQVGFYWYHYDRQLWLCVPLLSIGLSLGLTDNEEWQVCMAEGSLSERLKKTHKNAHFCPDFDDLLIHDGMDEMNYCGCIEGQKVDF